MSKLASISLRTPHTTCATMEPVQVTFDGICYVDLKVEDDEGNRVTISVHRTAVKALLADITVAYGKAEARRNLPNVGDIVDAMQSTAGCVEDQAQAILDMLKDR